MTTSTTKPGKRARKPVRSRESHPLRPSERKAIVLAVESTFQRVKNLYDAVAPKFEEYGFRRPSAAVAARDISEKIENSIVQHCNSFTKGVGHADLCRHAHNWEVKICKDSGLTINQSKVIAGETYIVVNYDSESRVKKVWVLWDAQDAFFSPRKANSNARALSFRTAADAVEVLYERSRDADD